MVVKYITDDLQHDSDDSNKEYLSFNKRVKTFLECEKLRLYKNMQKIEVILISN